MKVNVTTVERLVEDSRWDAVDFLKIDCEGYDLAVLIGAQHLLENNRIGLVQFEYNWMWPNAGYTLAAALRLMESCGYVVRLLRHHKVWQFDYEDWGEYARFSNFVAFHPDSVFQKVLGPTGRL